MSCWAISISCSASLPDCVSRMHTSLTLKRNKLSPGQANPDIDQRAQKSHPWSACPAQNSSHWPSLSTIYHLKQALQCPMPLPSLIYIMSLSTCFTFRVTLQKATSGCLGSSSACGQHLQGPHLCPQLLWQEDLPAAIWRNSRHMKYRELFTTEQCWFALKMLEAAYRHGKVRNQSLAAARNGQLFCQNACVTQETVLVPHLISNLLPVGLHAWAWQMTGRFHFRLFTKYSSWREKDRETEEREGRGPGRPYLPSPQILASYFP